VRVAVLVVWLGLVILLMPAGTAAAQTPITDREYAIELYEGVAIGDSVQTGMGGAGAARILGSAGALINPAAPAVRKTTDNDRWSWDYHFDLLTGQFSTDYDNNGVVGDDSRGAQLVTLGLAFRYGKWAIAATVTGQSAPLDGAAQELDATTSRVRLVLARFFPSWDLAVGIGTQTIYFTLEPEVGDPLFTVTGNAGVAGLTWLPRGQSFRVALASDSRILGAKTDVENCMPENCEGFILPKEIESPGRVIAGLSYRWAASPWNQQVKPKFRDERAVTLSTDVVFAGSTTRGHGLEAFGMMQLQPVGQSITISPRAGVEVEAIPGRLRFRGGSYWEPGRYEGVGGRIHGTFGFEVRWLEFKLWGLRRGRLGATFDLASRYRNLGLSVGFWQ
jgi:hypothetical protein